MKILSPPFLILLPWICLLPAVVCLEITKLDLPATWSLNTESRQNHFLAIAMPGLENDYFLLVQEAQKMIQKKPLRYAIHMDSHLSEMTKFWVRYYTVYALCPAKLDGDESLQSFLFRFRSPPDKGESVTAVIPGTSPSYLVSTKQP